MLTGVSGRELLATTETSTNERLIRRPRYEVICDALRDGIITRRIDPQLVLLEGPIARVFGTSRGPVRQALEQLHEGGLISRFKGRGFIASVNGDGLEPSREVLTPKALGLDDSADFTVDMRPAADRIFAEVEEAVAMCIAFGHFRIVEATVSSHFGVSRTVVREVLGRLCSYGLVEKGRQSHWVAGPLTAKAVAEDYEIRALLEPAALRASGPKLDRATLVRMHDRLTALSKSPASQLATTVSALEHDLHSDCLGHANNRKVSRIIEQSQLPIMVNHIFFHELGVSPDEPIFLEHRRVIEHLLNGAYDDAASSLEWHLRATADRTCRRLKVLSVFQEPGLPPYLVRIA